MTHSVSEVRKFIAESDNFYITGHVNADGDSIGACLSLAVALEKIGKKVSVLLESFHLKYNVVPGRHLICEAPPLADGTTDDGFTLICVDCADIGRLTDVSRVMIERTVNTLCIDHHFSNTQFAKINFVDSKCSSTCEMVYRLLDGFIEIDKDIASAIYAGIISDTGGFRHAATGFDTMNVSAELIGHGIPFTEIYTEIMHRRTYTETKLLARILDACRRNEDKQIVYACVPISMMKNFHDTPDAAVHDLEGVVEYLLNIRRANVSLLVYEKSGGKSKISLRSRKINVGAIAQQFGGGGHNLAAGATVDGDVFEVCEKAIALIEKALAE